MKEQIYVLTFKKYGSNCLGIGQVQNGILYLRYGSSPKINTARWCKNSYTWEPLAILA